MCPCTRAPVRSRGAGLSSGIPGSRAASSWTGSGIVPLVCVGSARPMNVLLTEPQVEKLVQRYLLEMARYERTAAAVAERLRRELRAEAQLRYLLAFRAKHPEDLRGKLLRKAK